MYNEEVPTIRARHSSIVDHFLRWLYQSAWPGMGLFGESYILFSIGTLRPIWEQLFPDCFSYEECPSWLIHSLTYSVIGGVILGMLAVGYLASSLGRRWGSLLTATLMASGAIGLLFICCALTDKPLRLYYSMAIILFFFGVGVGGEYPLSAASASEKAIQHQLLRERLSKTCNEECSDSQVFKPFDQERRGRTIQLVFAMQGFGIWFNCLTLMLLLLATGQIGGDKIEQSYLVFIWRITYLIGAIILVSLLVTRYLFLKESQVWTHDRHQIQKQTMAQMENLNNEFTTVVSAKNPVLSSHSNSQAYYNFSDEPHHPLVKFPLRLLLNTYGIRLLGASLSWLLWDVAFYGNKLFQSAFLLAVMGEDVSLFDFATAATLNATAALFGYFGAAFLIDNHSVGRLRLQVGGFFITGLLFLVCGVSFRTLPSWLLVIFFGQLGPNATTYIVPAEIFPTEMRTFCHGIAAASGKVGALFSAVYFPIVAKDEDLFLICSLICFIACFITLWTVPDTTGLDLFEIDKKWRKICCGDEYEGPANHPDHLSMYERRKS